MQVLKSINLFYGVPLFLRGLPFETSRHLKPERLPFSRIKSINNPHGVLILYEILSVRNDRCRLQEHQFQQVFGQCRKRLYLKRLWWVLVKMAVITAGLANYGQYYLQYNTSFIIELVLEVLCLCNTALCFDDRYFEYRTWHCHLHCGVRIWEQWEGPFDSEHPFMSIMKRWPLTFITYFHLILHYVSLLSLTSSETCMHTSSSGYTA